MEKTPFYTATRAEEVALDAIKQRHVHFYSTGASSDEESAVRKLTETILEETFSNEVDTLNFAFGTRKRKTMQAITDELTRRGILWADVFGDLSSINVIIGDSRFRIDMSSGINLTLLSPESSSEPVKTHHCTAGVAEVVDFLVFFSTVKPKIVENISKSVFRDHKAAMLCEIEFPSVEQKVQEFMDPRGLNYRLYIQSPKIIFDVQILKEIWMRNTLTTENVEQVVRLVPYLIKRPDCIKHDGLGFKIVHIYR